MKRFLSVALLISIAIAGPACSTEIISWDELIDQDAQVFEDPFLDLDYNQLDDLRTYAIESSRIQNAELSDEQRSKSILKRKEAFGRLQAEGINAQKLLDQRWVVADLRKKAASSANPDIENTTVSLGGFAIPAPPADDGTKIVYLVPERGMCSHVPPPNPNQMIRARVNGDWTPSMMHEPVRLTGTLTAEETNRVFRIVDGDVPMRASFIMHVQKVETMDDFRAHVRVSDPLMGQESQMIDRANQLISQGE